MRTINEHVAAFRDDLTLRNYSQRTASDYGYSLRSLATFLDQRRIADVSAITSTNLADFQRWLYHQPTKHGAARGVCHQNAVLAAVQRQLGHKSLRTTQLYTRVAIPDLVAMHAKAHPRSRSARRTKPATAAP